MIYNSTKGSRKRNKTEEVHHYQRRGTALPMYLGLLIHSKTRKRDLVDTLHKNGLCNSYERVLQISTSLSNAAIKQFQIEGVVCPPKLRKGLFYTGNLDNTDHNPSSTSAKDSFHGTAISLIGHVTNENSGTLRERVVANLAEKDKKVSDLPESFTSVPPSLLIPSSPEPCEDLFCLVTKSIDENLSVSKWIEKVTDILEQEQMNGDINISWSAYLASQQETVPRPPALGALLPLQARIPCPKIAERICALVNCFLKIIK